MGRTENPCTASGCPAACCANIRGTIENGNFGNFKKAFPNATEAGSREDLTKSIREARGGVSYYQEGGTIYYAVSGTCPNLQPDNGCRIHGQRYYPQTCTNMIKGSLACEEAKMVNGINLRVMDYLNRHDS